MFTLLGENNLIEESRDLILKLSHLVWRVPHLVWICRI